MLIEGTFSWHMNELDCLPVFHLKAVSVVMCWTADMLKIVVLIPKEEMTQDAI